MNDNTRGDFTYNVKNDRKVKKKFTSEMLRNIGMIKSKNGGMIYS